MSTNSETDIDLYTFGTPNGHKVSIALEELGLKYNVHRVDITKNVQKEDWYLKINPNGRIPAIVDRTRSADGQAREQRVFEGAAILLYLTAKYDPDHKISFPYGSPEYWESVSWLEWQHGGLGPMQGQANHFATYAPEKIPYAINRYLTETKRLYSIMEKQLELQQEAQDNKKTSDGPWLVGDKISIADLACFSWIYWVDLLSIDLSAFPHITEWRQRITARDGIQRGLAVPEKHDKTALLEKHDQLVKEAREWIIKGQQEDHAKFK